MIEVNPWCSLRNRMQPFLFTSVQLVTYPIQMSDLLPFNHFLTPLQSPNLLPFDRIFYPLTIPQLTPLQSHFYPLTNVRLTPLQSISYSPTPSMSSLQAQYLTLTNVRLTPLQTCYLPRTTVRLTPYNHLTYSPSNTLLILYKPLSNPTSIECLFRKNVRVIPSSNVVNASPFNATQRFRFIRIESVTYSHTTVELTPP